MNTVQQLRRSWVAAEDDLGIEVEFLSEAVLVRGFGSTKGMMCAIRETREEQRELQREAEMFGTGWSVLGPSYLKYDRVLFIDTLNDWGWCGSGGPPPWYSDEPWSV